MAGGTHILQKQPSRWNRTKKFLGGIKTATVSLFNKVNYINRFLQTYKNNNTVCGNIKYVILNRGEIIANIIANNVSGKLIGTVADTDCPDANYYQRLLKKGLISKIGTQQIINNNPGNQNNHITYNTNPRIYENSGPRILVYKEIDGKSQTQPSNQNNISSHVVYRYLTDGSLPSFNVSNTNDTNNIKDIFYLFMVNYTEPTGLQQAIINIYKNLEQSGRVNQDRYKDHINDLSKGFEEHQNNDLISIKDRFLSGTPETNSIYEKCKELFKNNKLGLVYKNKNKNKNDKVQIIVNNALTESVSDVDKVKGIYVFAIVVSAAKPNKQTMGEYMSVSQFRKTASGPNASEYQDLAANGGYIEPHIPGSEYLAVRSA